MASQQADFEIKVVPGQGGGFNVTIKQLTGVTSVWDPMFGGTGQVDPVVLTPFEAETLVKEINDAIRQARNSQQKAKYNLP